MRRRVALIGLVIVLLIGGYWFWLRDSSLVAVDEVEVKGATADRAEVAAALERAADGMTTLNVDDEKLAEAVAGFPTVASIAADATLLHKLTITVTERLPVAVVKVEGEPTGVAADGLLLPGLEVRGKGLPAMQAGARGPRVDGEGVAQAAIMGAAPEEVRGRIEASAFDAERGGVVLEIEGAPEARFGDAGDAEAKWKALAAVLLAPDLGAPGYVDVSVPERPVSGD